MRCQPSALSGHKRSARREAGHSFAGLLCILPDMLTKVESALLGAAAMLLVLIPIVGFIGLALQP